MSEQTTTEQNQIRILSAKILKGKAEDPDDVKINYIEYYKDNSKGKIPGEFNRQPHPDFKEALSNLRVHLALLADQIDQAQTNDEALISKFHVHGFHFTGDKNKGFIILGSKEGKYGRVGLNTRTILFDSKTFTDEYPLAEICTEALTKAAQEAAAYVRGKHLPDPQGNLFDSATNAQVAKPVMFPEGESDQSELYGQEPAEVIEKGMTSVGSRLPKADPEAMKRVARMGKPATSVENVVSNIVAEVNGKMKKGKKSRQTSDNPSGEETE
jgi:hypothetical protein